MFLFVFNCFHDGSLKGTRKYKEHNENVTETSQNRHRHSKDSISIDNTVTYYCFPGIALQFYLHLCVLLVLLVCFDLFPGRIVEGREQGNT